MKSVPFTREQVMAWGVPTPFYVYDQCAIRSTARELSEAFAWADFKEHFAVKATPNPRILSLLREEGCGADCSSMAELVIAERTGLRGDDIMFSSNNTPLDEFQKALSLDAILNLDDASHLTMLERGARVPSVLSLRYNPGGDGGNFIIGSPEESKFGMTKEQLLTTARVARAKGVKRLGVHCMTASNTHDAGFFEQQARMVFALVVDMRALGTPVSFVNFGGGVGIPYGSNDVRLTFDQVSSRIRVAYEDILGKNNMKVQLRMELGRAMTGPHGYLVTKVQHVKQTYHTYVGVDACMANLMRPGMYNAYHHITALGNTSKERRVYNVVGGLCENNDQFAKNRELPKLTQGDILVIHDVGAHGHAMGFNYNGKLRSAEFLLGSDANLTCIRRAETVEDYLRTVNWE